MPDKKSQFDTQGFCYIENVVPPDRVAAIKESVERDVWAHNLLERPTGYVPGFLRFNHDLAPYMTARPILDLVESCFGPHARISMVSGIVNGAGIPRGLIHSDWPYNQKGAAHIPAPYPKAVLHIVTMWMLTDFTPENGGTIVVPGSHLRDCHPLEGGALDPAQPAPGETQLIGKAGTVAAFDARLWHAVAPNISGTDRVAVLVRYAPWWLNLDTLRPGTVDHHDIVEANEGKDSVVPPLSREVFDRLPQELKPLLRYQVTN
ncbi:MAG: phytanoyl-CoA dioxygenase family protein [Bryobacteraceae bacterium]